MPGKKKKGKKAPTQDPSEQSGRGSALEKESSAAKSIARSVASSKKPLVEDKKAKTLLERAEKEATKRKDQEE